MAAADWTELTGGLVIGSLDRGVTSGIARPSGGGNFVYGYNSLVNTPGAHGVQCNLASFSPMAKGGSIRGAVQRGVSGGPTNFSPLLYIGGQGTALTDTAYILGLQDDDPHRIVLRKGAINGGVPAGIVGTNGILARSTATYAPGTWLHLRLDMIFNTNGDVILVAKQSDLDTDDVTAPSWVAIPGIDDFTDDALGINSGSAPYTSGRAGWAFCTLEVSRRGFFDHIELLRQT